MRDRFDLSASATRDLQYLTKEFRIAGTNRDWIICRIAFAYSLTHPEAPGEVDGSADTAGDNRKQVPYTAFYKDDQALLVASLRQFHAKHLTDDELHHETVRHVEHGLAILAENVKRIGALNLMVERTRPCFGRDPIGIPPSPGTGVPHDQEARVIQVTFGEDVETSQSVVADLNRHQNPHLAIVGGTGSGKTTLILNLLRQIREASQFQTQFVMFDYKDGAVARNASFIGATRATVVDVAKTPLPLSPFKLNSTDDRLRKQCAERLTAVVRDVEAQIGKVQEQTLYDAIVKALDAHTPYPDFHDVLRCIKGASDKPDSLTSVFRPLTEQAYFARRSDVVWDWWSDRTVVVDVHSIEKKALVVFFVLDKIMQELRQRGEAPTADDGTLRHLRTVVVLDEAHNFLSDRKRAQVLEKMIREIRSMGGMVVLSSQSPDDYNKTDFDFLELIEFVLILQSTPQSSRFIEQKLGVDSAQGKRLLRTIQGLSRGEAITKLRSNPDIQRITLPYPPS